MLFQEFKVLEEWGLRGKRWKNILGTLLIYLYRDTSFSSFSLRGTYQKVFLSLSSIRLTLLHQTPINLYLIFYILELNLIFSLVEKSIYFSINFIATIFYLKFEKKKIYKTSNSDTDYLGVSLLIACRSHRYVTTL